MTSLIEFLDEDELLAEFHAAGILLPEELREIKRQRTSLRHQYALSCRALTPNLLGQQGRLVAGQFPPANPFSASLLGNILGRSIL